jgi:alanine dehydrogenase
MKDAVESIRNVFREHYLGRTKTYPRVHIPFDQYNGTIGYMEASVDALGSSAAKIVGLYHTNPQRFSLPRVLALIALNRTDNGLPVAIMDGTYLTMLRTRAVGAVAADHLSRRDSKCAGIIGAGVQGRGQLEGLMEVRRISEVAVYDVVRSASESFAAQARKRYGIDVRVVDSAQDLKRCDIIASATPSKTPVITNELLEEGVHINSVGIGAGLGKHELDFAVIRKAKTVVDDLEVARMDALQDAYSTRAVSDRDLHGTLGELVSGAKPGRTEESEVTLFISSGMAIQDVAVAKLVYDKAVSMGIGNSFNFFQ